MNIAILLLILCVTAVHGRRPKFTPSPTIAPSATPAPTRRPTSTRAPSFSPTSAPPTFRPTLAPTRTPTMTPTVEPTQPTSFPSVAPTTFTPRPSAQPTSCPSALPTVPPSSSQPTSVPSSMPTITYRPTPEPSFRPTRTPTLSSRTEVTIDVEMLLDEAISANLIGDADVEAVIIETLLEFLTDLDEDSIMFIGIEDPNASVRRGLAQQQKQQKQRKQQQRQQHQKQQQQQHQKQQQLKRRLQVDQTLITAQLTFIVEALGYSSTTAAEAAINDILQQARESGALTEALNNNAVAAGVDDLFNALVSSVNTRISSETLLFSFEPTSDPARSPSEDEDDEFFLAWPLYAQVLFVGGTGVLIVVLIGVLLYVCWESVEDCCYCCFLAAGGRMRKPKQEAEDDDTSGGGSGSDVEGGHGGGGHHHSAAHPLLCCLACCAHAEERQRKREEEAAAAEAAAIAASPKRRYTYASETGQLLKVRTDTSAQQVAKPARRGTLMSMLLDRKKSDAQNQSNPNMIEVHTDKAEVEMRCVLEVQADGGGSVYTGPLTGAIEFDVMEFPTKSELEEIERQKQLLLEQQQLEQQKKEESAAGVGAAGLAKSASEDVQGGVMDAMFRAFMQPAPSESVDDAEDPTGAAAAAAPGITLPPVPEGEELTEGGDEQQGGSTAGTDTEHHSHVPKFLKAGYWKKKLFKKNEHGEDVEVNMVELEAGFASVHTSSAKHLASSTFQAAADPAAEEAELMKPGSMTYGAVQYTPKSMQPADLSAGLSTSVDTQGTVMDAVFQALVLDPTSLQAESAESLIAPEERSIAVGGAAPTGSQAAPESHQHDSAKSSGGLSVLGRLFGEDGSSADDNQQGDVSGRRTSFGHGGGSVNGSQVSESARSTGGLSVLGALFQSGAAEDDGDEPLPDTRSDAGSVAHSHASATSVRTTASAAAFGMLSAMFGAPADSTDGADDEQELSSAAPGSFGLPTPPSGAAGPSTARSLPPMSPFEVDQQSSRYIVPPSPEPVSGDESTHGILKSGASSKNSSRASTPRRKWFGIRFAPNTKGGSSEDGETNPSSDHDDATSRSSGGEADVVIAPRTPTLRSGPSSAAKYSGGSGSAAAASAAENASEGSSPAKTGGTFSKPKSMLKGIKRRLSNARRGSQSSASSSGEDAAVSSEGLSDSAGES